MFPNKEEEEAKDKRAQAARLLKEADDLEKDAKDRRQQLQNIAVQIAAVAQQEKNAMNKSEKEEADKMARERADLERQKNDIEGGQRPIL